MVLREGGETVELIHVPNAHTDGDTLPRFRKANVIAMGDVFFNGIFPFIDLSSGGSVQGMIRGVDTALRMTNAENQNRSGARARCNAHRAARVQIHAGDDRADCAERDEGRPAARRSSRPTLPRRTGAEWKARRTGSSKPFTTATEFRRQSKSEGPPRF